jgi:DNA-binding transcriptional LysR family regulator
MKKQSILAQSVFSQEAKVFLEVATHLNMSIAAEKLKINQPSVSKAIQRFEDQMQRKLLSRTNTGVKLTFDGQLLRQQLEAAAHEMGKNSKQDIFSEIRLGCHQSIAMDFFSSLIPALKKHYPETRLQISFDSSYQITRKVAARELDIGLVINPVKTQALIHYFIRKEKVSLWSSGKKKEPKMMLRHPDMLYATRVENKELESLSIPDYEVMAKMVADHSDYVAVLPDSIAARHHLHRHSSAIFSADLGLIVHEDQYPREDMKRFFAQMKACFLMKIR